jgi:hypothetical protein
MTKDTTLYRKTTEVPAKKCTLSKYIEMIVRISAVTASEMSTTLKTHGHCYGSSIDDHSVVHKKEKHRRFHPISPKRAVNQL